ncbi:hypothetical protein, partial [Methanosarcina acetivorans]
MPLLKVDWINDLKIVSKNTFWECKYMGFKKALAILVLVCFVLSMTIASASACSENDCDCKDKCDYK